MKIRTLLASLAAASLASTAAAQVTHDVDVGAAFAFTPADLQIAVGDTVRWTWQGGLHNVESGTGGTHDGIFTSGAPTSAIGVTFSVTFDAAFLAANTVPGNVYDYYCLVHESFGQTGTVRVLAPIQTYGCLNPPGSLTVLAGFPSLGGSVTLGVDDPPGSSAPGSFAILLLATAPAPNFPCGLAIPGLGMSGPAGDLLVSVSPPNPIAFLGPAAWAGSGTPAPIVVPIPSSPGLVGFGVHVQGLLGGAGTTKVTEGVLLVIQP